MLIVLVLPFLYGTQGLVRPEPSKQTFIVSPRSNGKSYLSIEPKKKLSNDDQPEPSARFFKLIFTPQSGSPDDNFQIHLVFTPCEEQCQNSPMLRVLRAPTHRLEVFVFNTNLSYVYDEPDRDDCSVEIVSQGWYRKVETSNFQCHSDEFKCFYAETRGDFGNFDDGINIFQYRGHLVLRSYASCFHLKTDVIPIKWKEMKVEIINLDNESWISKPETQIQDTANMMPSRLDMIQPPMTIFYPIESGKLIERNIRNFAAFPVTITRLSQHYHLALWRSMFVLPCLTIEVGPTGTPWSIWLSIKLETNHTNHIVHMYTVGEGSFEKISSKIDSEYSHCVPEQDTLIDSMGSYGVPLTMNIIVDDGIVLIRGKCFVAVVYDHTINKTTLGTFTAIRAYNSGKIVHNRRSDFAIRATKDSYGKAGPQLYIYVAPAVITIIVVVTVWFKYNLFKRTDKK